MEMKCPHCIDGWLHFERDNGEGYLHCLICGYDEPIGAPTLTPAEAQRWATGWHCGEPREPSLDREKRKRISRKAKGLAMGAA